MTVSQMQSAKTIHEPDQSKSTNATRYGLGLIAGLKAYRAHQALRKLSAKERADLGITLTDIPRIAARDAGLIA